MSLTDAEVGGCAATCTRAGSWWWTTSGARSEWANFESEIRRVLPGLHGSSTCRRDHPLFSAFYDIKEFLQVPNVGNAMAGRTSERDGYTPFYRGIFDDKGRLMVAINANTDLGDAWEWAEGRSTRSSTRPSRTRWA